MSVHLVQQEDFDTLKWLVMYVIAQFLRVLGWFQFHFLTKQAFYRKSCRVSRS